MHTLDTPLTLPRGSDELARPSDQGDRDHDCVREISTVEQPAALAAELVIERR